jgi:DNA-binding transcriptional LysR family regulator
MTLEQLRIFVAVAEREHMTAAARVLNVTQSAVSAAIAALEERHDVKLFHRVGRGIALTEAGRIFLDEARAVLVQAQNAERVLNESAGLGRGVLRLVASQTTAAYWLPPILAEYRKRHPGITIELSIGNSEQAATQVETGSADLGIVEGRIDNPALASWQVGEDKLLLVEAATGPEHPTDPKWLAAARWVSRERGSGTRSTFDAAMRGMGIEPDDLSIALTLPSNESVRTAVEAGAGITALSALVVGSTMESGRLRALPVDLGPRPFYALRHKERYSTKAAEALLELIAEQPGNATGGLAPAPRVP